MKYVPFVCTQNAGRSRMAQAFFERYAHVPALAQRRTRECLQADHCYELEAV